MKRSLTIIFCLIIFSLVSFCKDLQIETFELLGEHDLTARTDSREDLNGNLCALLKVYVDDQILDVRGNVVGENENIGLENNIYLTNSSKEIEIVFEKHFPLKIVFEDYNIPALTGGLTYVLKLIDPLENASVDINKDMVSDNKANELRNKLREKRRKRSTTITDDRYKDILEFKIKYIIQEIDIDPSKEGIFIELYEDMELNKRECFYEVNQKRSLIKQNKKTPEKDFQELSILEEKADKDWVDLEKYYLNALSQFLTQEQIFRMKEAETRFQRKIQELRNQRENKK